MCAHFDWNVYRGGGGKSFQETGRNAIRGSDYGCVGTANSVQYVAFSSSISVVNEAIQVLVDNIVAEMLRVRDQSAEVTSVSTLVECVASPSSSCRGSVAINSSLVLVARFATAE